MANKILITGGTGFIGSHLARRLTSSGHQVTVIGRRPRPSHTNLQALNLTVMHGDLCNRKMLDKGLLDTEIVFHKASSYAPMREQSEQDLFQANIRGTETLIEAIKHSSHSVRHVIFDSSISVYGEGCYSCKSCGKVRPNLRTKVSVLHKHSFDPPCPSCGGDIAPVPTGEEEVLNGESNYARAKKVQENLLRLAAEELGFALSIFRYATVYGFEQSRRSPYVRILEALIRGEAITLYEDGQQRRDFIYVDDVICANLLAISADSGAFQTFNIGSGTETPLIEFISHARDVIQSQFRRVPGRINITNTLYEGDIRHCRIDCSAAETLGFTTKISWQQGLESWVSSYFSKAGDYLH